ncbi:helix-turn-helix transcriptional regulator [Phenylobacterium sp.]|uniref:helix-turn-helix domain-containing protein n=1 Tax=Phenylobacterium sp. TaxID=1871053 RepID=UPI00301DDE53
MDLATYRKHRRLSQRECARELGLTSKSYISQLETGKVRFPVKLALRIQHWSGGAVPAVEICPDVREFIAAEVRP